MANVLLGVTGSVAAIKTPDLVSQLIRAGHVVKVVVTEPALYFFRPSELRHVTLIREADEWPPGGYHRGDPVLHIALRKWADVFAIAPLDANTLAKLANGLADNCLTCVARAWDLKRPLILAPAMNTLMWQHPITARHLRRLARDRGKSPPRTKNAEKISDWINGRKCGLKIVLPVVKELACGDVGAGGMAEVDIICAAIPKQ
jgi:phosphopantothenoylcysteine decarboxylase